MANTVCFLNNAVSAIVHDMKLPLVLSVIVVLVAGGFVWEHSREDITDAAAKKIVASCKSIQGDHAECYEAQVPNLYPELSVPQIFDVVREIRVLDTSYQFCHVLAHLVGERVVAEDPENWINAIPLNPVDGLCSNGFVHGVVGGRFRADVLDDATLEKYLPEFKLACEPHAGWEPSSLDSAMCYHGMGHLFDFITNANLPKALEVCDRVVPHNYRRVCVQGVFMQIYQPLEPDDFELIKQLPEEPSKENVRRLCSRFAADPMAEGSCLAESWPLFEDDILAGDVKTFCSGYPNSEEQRYCYISMSSIIGRMTLGNEERALKACAAFPGSEQASCFGYSAQAVLEEDRNDSAQAISLCEHAPETVSESCIAQLIEYAHFTFGANTVAHEKFCSQLSGHNRDTCFAQLKSTQ